MPDNAITESELDHYRTWIGRRTTLHDDVCRDVIARFAVAIDRPMPVDDLVPQMWHYGLFLNAFPQHNLVPMAIRLAAERCRPFTCHAACSQDRKSPSLRH